MARNIFMNLGDRDRGSSDVKGVYLCISALALRLITDQDGTFPDSIFVSLQDGEIVWQFISFSFTKEPSDDIENLISNISKGELDQNDSAMGSRRVFQDIAKFFISGNKYHPMFLSIPEDFGIG